MKHRNRVLSLALALMLLLSAAAGCAPKRTVKETLDTTFGVDVAKYQGIIDWQQVADSGIDFAMVRVGYRTIEDGELREDPSARYNLQEASKAGIKLGVYFFSTAVNEEEVKEEAQWVIQFIAKYPITYPVVYDCENYADPNSRQYTLTKQERTDLALMFLQEITKAGYEGMFYSSRNEMNNENQWEISRIDSDYKIWVAQYPEQPYPLTAESTYYGNHHMWQYTTQGTVPGIAENVDMNVAYFGYDGVEKPHDNKPPVEVEADLEAFMDFQDVEEMVTAKVETNLRNIPSQGEDSHVLFTIQNGQYARRIAISNNGWSKLEYEGLVCYAVSSYLTNGQESASSGAPAVDHDGDGIFTEFTPVNYSVTAKDKVNLRALPSVEREDAVVITQLKKGDTATCVGISDNGWSKLEYQGKTCYAVSSYLEILSETQEMSAESEASSTEIKTKFTSVNEKVTPKEKVNLRRMPSTEHPDAVVVATVTNGVILERTGINDDVGWSRVVYNGEVLYCVSRYVKVVG